MEHQENKTDTLLETIRKELISIIEGGSENNEQEQVAEQAYQNYADSSKISSPSICEQKETSPPKHELSSGSAVLSTTNISSIHDDIQKLHNNLNESCKLFQSIEERLEGINFGCLKHRIKDLHLDQSNAEPITIVKNFKYSSDEKYIQNRLSSLTKEITSKFRNHPGEFCDISEISEFFRACTKLEQGLEKLKKERNYCLDLQKRVTRIAEASYDRINDIQQQIMREEDKKSE